MKKINIEEVKTLLSKDLERYIKAILEQYGKYITDDRKNMLERINDFKSIININSYGSINGFATDKGVHLPLDAEKVLKKMRMIPGSGINKKHKTYNDSNLIINNNTFFDYIKHVFIKGITIVDYYKDLLLHETLHFCGGVGGSAFNEGLNEFLTRKIALKNNFITNACGYPKEVKVVYEFEKLFGEEITNQLAFIKNFSNAYLFLKNTLGEHAAELYKQTYITMDKEFYNKYYQYMDNYNGLTGIFKKYFNYRKIDYSKVYELLKNFRNIKVDSNIKNNSNVNNNISERKKLINMLKEEKERYEGLSINDDEYCEKRNKKI